MKFAFYLDNDDLAIINNQPLLYIKSLKSMVLGDIHCGQHESVTHSGTSFISKSTKKISKSITDAIQCFNVETVIFNGDIKHNTTRLTLQEKKELNYIFSNESLLSRKIVIVKGNHDKILKLSVLKSILSHWEFTDAFVNGGYYITHGDLPLTKEFTGHTVILSHEHPAFTIRGLIGESVKQKAFITMKAQFFQEKKLNVVIVPAAGEYTSGCNFPIFNKKKFLSPFLRLYALTEKQTIYPLTNYGPIKYEVQAS